MTSFLVTTRSGAPGAGHDLTVVPGFFVSGLDRFERHYRGRMITCDFCGRTAEEGAETLTWTTAVEQGRQRRYCAECSRQHLRSMEGKLDSEHW